MRKGLFGQKITANMMYNVENVPGINFFRAEGNETVTNCHGLKMIAGDCKTRTTKSKSKV